MKRSKAKEHNLTRYFTGKPCPHGHMCERYTSSGGCSECIQTHTKKSRIEHPVRFKEYTHTSYWKNPEKHREASNQQYMRNRDKPEFREESKKRVSEWVKDNPDKAWDIRIRYRSSPKGLAKMNELASHRRARKLQQTSDTADINAIARIYLMAQRMTLLTGRRYEVDHILPLSKGGLHHQDNLIVMLGSINRAKHMEYWEWLHWFNSPV